MWLAVDLFFSLQETRHYTKVISQEQIAAWNCGPPSTSPTPTPMPAAEQKTTTNKREISKSHLSSIFSCKVCFEPFLSKLTPFRTFFPFVDLFSHGIATFAP